MSLWDSLSGLELRVDHYGLERRESVTPSGWTRVTTTVVVTGEEETGQGEDVTYEPEMHDDVPDDLMLAGTWSFEDFSYRLDELEELGEGYRRWAFESAALDLALRQAGAGLGEALGRRERPALLDEDLDRRFGVRSARLVGAPVPGGHQPCSGFVGSTTLPKVELMTPAKLAYQATTAVARPK